MSDSEKKPRMLDELIFALQLQAPQENGSMVRNLALQIHALGAASRAAPGEGRAEVEKTARALCEYAFFEAEYDELEDDDEIARGLRDRLIPLRDALAALRSAPPEPHEDARMPPPEPRRDQCLPCGCVVCICEDEDRCHGCGAKKCGTHSMTVGPAAPPPEDSGARRDCTTCVFGLEDSDGPNCGPCYDGNAGRLTNWRAPSSKEGGRHG